MIRGAFFILFQTIIFSCFASDPIKLFLKNPDCITGKYFLDLLYDKEVAQAHGRQFERLLPALYQKDVREAVDKPENRLIVKLFKLIGSLLREPYGLSWCSCNQAPEHLRVQLVFEVFDRVLRQFPDPSKRLVYTSYASGKLLQDLIVIAGLIELGYVNLTINLIDLIYNRRRKVLSGFYAPVVFQKIIRSFIENKKKENIQSSQDHEVIDYHNVYDYLHDVRVGVALKSNIVLSIDPGSDLLHKDFEYYGPREQASLINFELSKNSTEIALYIPRGKSIHYFYGKKSTAIEKEGVRRALQQAQPFRNKKNYSEHLVQAMCKELSVKCVTYFQSPFRSLDDLKYEGAIDRPILYQICDGLIFRDVRDGLPIKDYSKTWL